MATAKTAKTAKNLEESIIRTNSCTPAWRDSLLRSLNGPALRARALLPGCRGKAHHVRSYGVILSVDALSLGTRAGALAKGRPFEERRSVSRQDRSLRSLGLGGSSFGTGSGGRSPQMVSPPRNSMAGKKRLRRPLSLLSESQHRKDPGSLKKPPQIPRMKKN